MSHILNIDTSEQVASVSIANNGVILTLQKNEIQNNHAAFLHTAIKKILESVTPQKINAVAVVAGPGSYTGLRIGMSAAKGICYALNIPLITLNNLTLLAQAVQLHNLGNEAFLCPMIDARRMEVFTALYNPSFKEIISPKAEVINKDFIEYILGLCSNTLFIGSGSSKISNIYPISKLQVTNPTELIPGSIAKISNSMYYEENFANLALSEPIYIKKFYSH